MSAWHTEIKLQRKRRKWKNTEDKSADYCRQPSYLVFTLEEHLALTHHSVSFAVKSKHQYHVYVIGTCFCSLSYFCNLVEIAVCKWVSQLPLGFLLHQLAHCEDRKAWCHVRGRKPQNGSLLYSAVFCCILAQLQQGGAAQVPSYLLPHMVEAQHGLLFYYSMAFILFLRDVFSLSWIQCLCSECKLTRLKWGISGSY